MISIRLANERTFAGRRYVHLFYHTITTHYYEQVITRAEYDALAGPNPSRPVRPNPTYIWVNSYVGLSYSDTGRLLKKDYAKVNIPLYINVDDWILTINTTEYPFDPATKTLSIQPPGMTLINGLLNINDESLYRVQINSKRIITDTPEP